MTSTPRGRHDGKPNHRPNQTRAVCAVPPSGVLGSPLQLLHPLPSQPQVSGAGVAVGLWSEVSKARGVVRG